MQAGTENRKGASFPREYPNEESSALPADNTDRSSLKFRVCEIYSSTQGEGRLTGTPSIFLRTSGCNLRCWFCDTPFASWQPEGPQLSLDEIVARCQTLMTPEIRHVVITGGEPMICPGLPELTTALRALGLHITIETAGTVDLPVVCDLMSVSPKMSNSTPSPLKAGAWAETHEQRRENLPVVNQLLSRYDYQLKFVIDSPADIDEVIAYLERLEEDPTPNNPLETQKVLLMPQGTELSHLQAQTEWLLPAAEKHGFQFCPRSHIQWFGNQRGT